MQNRIKAISPEHLDDWGGWSVTKALEGVAAKNYPSMAIREIDMCSMFGRDWFRLNFWDGDVFLVNPDKIMNVELFKEDKKDG